MASEQADSNGRNEPYIFHRDFNSSVRLNYNHWLMKEITGYLLHPKIQITKDNARIADVGTGTGIWLTELVDQFPPSARFDGFDISAMQYPPQEWTPSNIHLSVQDTYKPFPEEHLGVYDVVHLRFALCYVNNVDAEPLLENLITLLKPGGYLQWYEPIVVAGIAKAAKPSSSMTAMKRLAQSFVMPKPGSTFNWITERPSLYEKHGLEVVDSQTIKMKDRHRILWAHSTLLGLQDLVNSSHVMGTEEKRNLHLFMDQLLEEYADGVGLDTNWLCVVGRKRVVNQE